MRIIGIDPGLTKTGVGIIDAIGNSIFFVSSKTIYTNKDNSIDKRLVELHEELSKLIEEYRPDEAAIEETFVNVNPVSSLKLGHARGALILTVAKYNISIKEYPSTAVKKSIVGAGRADKNQISRMIQILIPKAACNSEDESDALAVAICHNNNRNSSLRGYK